MISIPTACGLACASVLALAVGTAAASQTPTAEAVPAAPSTDAPASSEQVSASAPPEGEIVVTAQFRSQRLQDTPLAITAVSGAALEAKGAATVLDVANTAPNVTMRAGAGNLGGAAQIFVRGVGQSDSSFAFEPGVGTYIDDVYYGSVFGAIFDLLDLDRVEVLRGPQGTLSGRNSIGGAVKLFSKKPADDDSGYIEAAYGRFNRLELKAGANLSLVPDKIMMRVSGISKQADGYSKRYDYGCLNPRSGVPSGASGNCKIGEEGGRNYQAGRLAFRILPSDRLELNLIGTVSVDNSQVAPQKLLAITTRSNIPAGIDPTIFITGPQERSNYATFINPAFTDPARYNGVPGAGSHPATALDPHFRLRAQTLSGSINWELADHLSLTSITAYQHYNGGTSADIDLTPYALNTVDSNFRYRQFTQELRLNGDLLNKILEYTVGAYYFDSKGKFSGANYNLPTLANENIYALQDTIPSKSKSAFAHLTANVTDKLSVIGGIRYTHDAKDYYYRRPNPYNPGLVAYTAAGLINGVEGHYRGNRTDYRANVQYRWSPHLMTYVQFSTGYRAGGVNPRPYVLDQAVPFDPETLKAYEAGFKADLFDRALRFNGAVFINNYNNIIFSNQSPTPTSTLNATPVNAGSAQFKGVELEANLRPLQGLQIDASGSYLGFHFKSIGAAGATITGISIDNRAPFAPKWKANAGMQYEARVGGIGSITPRVDVSYQSSFFTAADNDPRAKVPGYTLVNSRVTWADDEHGWQVALSITNLFNKYYYNTILKYPIGVVDGSPAAPREWKVSLRKNF